MLAGWVWFWVAPVSVLHCGLAGRNVPNECRLHICSLSIRSERKAIGLVKSVCNDLHSRGLRVEDINLIVH
jgi:hypothetical protein